MSHQPQLINDETNSDGFLSKEQERVCLSYTKLFNKYLEKREFRNIEGAPKADIQSLINLSHPPFYTASPNPFIVEILKTWISERKKIRLKYGFDLNHRENLYQREPFAVDISEGKNTKIYRAFSYHTKVPHKAIMRYILHYTDPGDIIFDGFCGTGMTGVAALLCGDRKAIKDLGFSIDDEGRIKDKDNVISYLGKRNTILNDLSPFATFIAYNFIFPFNAVQFEKSSKKAINNTIEETNWMFQTWHPSCNSSERISVEINYTVWSDVFVCPHCAEEIIFWDVAVDKETWQVKSKFHCLNCNNLLNKRGLDRVFITYKDSQLDKVIKQAKQSPVLIHYKYKGQTYTKTPDQADYELIDKIDKLNIPFWHPTNRMPEGDESRRNDGLGITHAHHFYTKRNLWVLAQFANHLKFARNYVNVTSVANIISKMYRFRSQNQSLGAGGGPLSGTLYMPSLSKEIPISKSIKQHISKTKEVRTILSKEYGCVIQTSSHTDQRYIPDNVIDYIFLDPPFGQNLQYSELNFLPEAWIGVFTNNKTEAVINSTQDKKSWDYQELMYRSFKEAYRILKPGRWITIEFHNSKNSVWNSIQEALQKAGFVVADVRTLDKKQGSFKQATAAGAVKQDLIISAYKPSRIFENEFSLDGGSEKLVWEFVRQHLKKLPVYIKTNDGFLEVVSERQAHLLYDRMIAYHIQKGISIPLSAQEFYSALENRFVEREGMFFLPDQIPVFDMERLKSKEINQLTMFIFDEKTTILWLRQTLSINLGGKQQNYQDLQPKFLQQLQQARHENLPELSEILEQNFLQDEQGYWYVPNPNKASDLEKIRNKALLREFNLYLGGEKKLRQFRTEAVRAGFADAWQRKDFATIIKVSHRLPEIILQEDPDLLMYYDNASLRVD
jgi:DNA modification methylase/predicted RNA-binding Zn-ribbon protein involved in translation (DUF1610 family)